MTFCQGRHQRQLILNQVASWRKAGWLLLKILLQGTEPNTYWPNLTSWNLCWFVWTTDCYPLLFIYVGTIGNAEENKAISRGTKEFWSKSEGHGQPGGGVSSVREQERLSWSGFIQWVNTWQHGWCHKLLFKNVVLPWRTWTAKQMTELAKVFLLVTSLTLWGRLWSTYIGASSCKENLMHCR